MLSQLNSKLKKHIPALISVWRKNADGSRLSGKELTSVSQSLLSLQRGLTGDRKLAGAGYMDSSSYLGAYLLYYWPVSYMQISLEAEGLHPFIKKENLRVLDIGSGPAPASAALCDSFSVKDVTLVDSSKKALDIARRLFLSEWKSCKVNALVHDFEAGQLPGLEGQFDIIVMSHSLNELWKDKKNSIGLRTSFLKNISSLLDKDGIILVSEPALLLTSRNLINVRDNLVQDGFSVISPCLCSQICPITEAKSQQTCHAEIAWKPVEPVASIARLAKLDRQSVKMTYMAFKKSLDSNADDRENSSNKIYKVVSDGMLNKSGRIRYLLCDGKKRIPLSAKKDDPRAKELGFFTLSRYDSVSLECPELRGDSSAQAFGISSDTKIHIQKFAL
ncbi:MAG: class I SAM-dependent methyltransferase [Treponema sp.]|nr:class I SAM-dependent methyltransferase [Treponema sp.]